MVIFTILTSSDLHVNHTNKAIKHEMWFLFSIKGRKNELQTKSEQCYIEHGEVKLETGFMKQNLKCFFTFVEGDTRSSWYRYSDGPPPILAMRNFSVKNKGKRYHSNIVFLNSFVIARK